MRTLPKGETLTLRRRTPRRDSGGELVTDAYGMAQWDEHAETVVGAAVWPLGGTGAEIDINVERTYRSYTVVLPEGVALPDAVDAVTWRGMSWEVLGEAQYHHNPFTGASLVMFTINRREG